MRQAIIVPAEQPNVPFASGGCDSDARSTQPKRPMYGARLEDIAAQIGVAGEVSHGLLDIVRVYRDALAALVGRGEGNLVEDALHHRLQAPRADVLDARIDLDRDRGQCVDGIIGEDEV